MRRVNLGLPIVLAAFAVASPAQAQQCTVPNTLVNGQVADATEVMDNFNAVAACVDDTKDDAVTHEGTPDAGEIAVFTSPTGITGGDLSGDVSTSGSTVTTLAPTGVAPGTYTNPTIIVDDKGRVTSAANGTAGGGSGWAILYSNTAIANPTPNVTVDVTGYNDVLVIGRGVTAAASGYRGVQISTDGGATFFKSTGDYEVLYSNGSVAGTYVALNHNTKTTAGRSFGGTIHAISVPGTPKWMENATPDPDRWFVGSFAPVTHIRVAVTASSGGADINMTGGQIFVMAR